MSMKRRFIDDDDFDSVICDVDLSELSSIGDEEMDEFIEADATVHDEYYSEMEVLYSDPELDRVPMQRPWYTLIALASVAFAFAAVTSL